MNEDLAETMRKTFDGKRPATKVKESPQVMAMKLRLAASLEAHEAAPKKVNPYATGGKFSDDVGNKTISQNNRMSAYSESEDLVPKKKRTNHNKRSEKYYEQIGMKLIITESFNHLTFRSKDMGGIFDGIATGNGQTRGVQICSHSSISARRKKMQDSPYLVQFIAGGNKAFILAWKLNEKGRWEPSEIEVLPK